MTCCDVVRVWPEAALLPVWARDTQGQPSAGAPACPCAAVSAPHQPFPSVCNLHPSASPRGRLARVPDCPSHAIGTPPFHQLLSHSRRSTGESRQHLDRGPWAPAAPCVGRFGA